MYLVKMKRYDNGKLTGTALAGSYEDELDAVHRTISLMKEICYAHSGESPAISCTNDQNSMAFNHGNLIFILTLTASDAIDLNTGLI